MNYFLHGHETERLRFAPFSPDYYKDWIDIFHQPDVARFVGLENESSPEEQSKAWFHRSAQRINNGLGGMNMLLHKETGRLVGQSGLNVQEVDGVRHLEVGYSILPQYWKQGYATEAARALRDHAFKNDITDLLISIIHVENHGSMKVAEANGMKLWKTTVFKESPVNIFSITHAEWRRLKQ